MNRVINWNKGSLFFVYFAMMVYFDNWSTGMWVYWALHGSYGFFWVLKDLTFPDKGFQRKQTLMSSSLVWIVAGPYYYFGYLMASRQVPQEPHRERIALAMLVYITGIVVMMGADGQKHFTLKHKKGLISDGFFKYTRNPNYLGEMMLYSAFAILL